MVAAASVRMPALATPTAPMRANSSSTMALKPTGRPRPYHCVGQCGAPQPVSISLVRHATRPYSDFQLASSQARTSARTEASVGSVMLVSSSRGPMLHHEFAMVSRVPEKHFRALRPFEPEMGILVPGEPDAAAHLNGVDRGLQIGVAGARLGK